MTILIFKSRSIDLFVKMRENQQQKSPKVLYFFNLCYNMFTREQKIWIVRNFDKSKGQSQLRRDFINHFKISDHKTVPQSSKFLRIVKSFEFKGTVLDQRSGNSGDFSQITEINIFS